MNRGTWAVLGAMWVAAMIALITVLCSYSKPSCLTERVYAPEYVETKEFFVKHESYSHMVTAKITRPSHFDDVCVSPKTIDDGK